MFEIPTISFIKKDPDATLPYTDDASDCGYKICSTTTKIIDPDDSVEFDTGLYMENIIKGAWIMLHSVEDKPLLEVFPKVIKNSFRGNLKIVLYNRSNNSYFIEPKNPIAQMMFFPLLTIEPKFVENHESL